MTDKNHRDWADYNNSPADSRSFGGPFGKLDAKIEEMRIESSTLERMRAIAAENDLQLTDFIRLALRISVWGEDHVASIAVNQIRRVGNRGGDVSGAGRVSP